MSTIAAGTTSGTALVSSGDTTGALQFQVNGTTPALTLATTGAVGVGSTPGYGTSGQFLRSNGSGSAASWAIPNTGPIGIDITATDYSLTLASAISAGAGATIRLQAVALDATKELLILHSTASAHAVVWDSSTNTFGTPALVRTASLGIIQTVALAAISSSSVLVCTLATTTTALETVVLSISGTTITVNTPLATTLAANSALIPAGTRLVAVGASYVLNYYTTTDSLPKFRAITVSGVTPSIGAELAYAGGDNTNMHHSYAYSSSILLHLSASATVVYAYPISVSGTTLTGGTQATATTTSSGICSGVLSTGNVALLYVNSTGRGAVVSIAGTTASISTAATTLTVTTANPQMQVFSNKAFILTGTGAGDQMSVLTDTSGTASVGTPVGINTGAIIGYLSSEKVFIAASATSGDSGYRQYGISAGAPVLEKTMATVTSQIIDTAQTFNSSGVLRYYAPLSNLPITTNSAVGTAVILRNASEKHATGSNGGSRPFATSIDGVTSAKIQQNPCVYQTYSDALSTAVGWSVQASMASTTTPVNIRRVELT